MSMVSLRPSSAARDSLALDRVALEGAIAALYADAEAPREGIRKSVVELFRNALTSGRAAITERFLEEGGGLHCARRLAALQDEIIQAIHAYVLRHVYPLDKPTDAERLCVVAVGGYGRGTLAPGSDIDLLFLLPYKQTAWGESVVEAILYVLWDLRQKVGHATRSVDECIRQAKADMTIRTSLIEARWIEGDKALFADMQTRFDKEVVQKTAREFVAAKLAEREVRINRAGVSRYVVEPNVKEGKGGLRDLNTLFWIAHYVYRVSDSEDLVAAGLFTRHEFKLFRRCEEFLWRVRCHLHLLAGRAEERLSFDYQRVIAERLGYGSHNGLSAVERFMKHYFLIAKDVGDLTAIVCAAMEEKEAKPPATLNRLMGTLLRKIRTIPGSDTFAIEVDRITVAHKDAFERDPVNLIRLFWASDHYALPIHPDATRLVTLSLRRIDAKVRHDPEANRLFMDILTSRNSPEIVLRRMNEAGVLRRFIPEFGRVVAMMQFNMYHHYTVDEHLLRAVGNLSEIDGGRTKEDHPLANELMPTVAARRALYVAVFLHDVAKGREQDHSTAGAELARTIGPRFGLSETETDLVAWLIAHHLVMSNTAQSRDLADRRTIETFAEIVQTTEQLKCLLILTICDIRAVGPGVWNGWKGQLLRTLYYETERLIVGQSQPIAWGERLATSHSELRAALPTWSEEELNAYVGRHYPPYWLRVDLPSKVRHAELLRSVAGQSAPLVIKIETDAFRAITELTLVTTDHPRLLSIIAGACATAGANIVDAQIFTTTDGLALDTFSVSRAFEQDADEERRAGRIANAISRTLRGEIRLSDAIAAKAGPPKGRDTTFPIEPEVIVDNQASNRHTVLQVSGIDRPALLYDLTISIARLNLNIASAHVATFGEKAVDTFYVTDLTGAKILDANRQTLIRRTLSGIFGAPERAVQPRPAPEVVGPST
ncbi:[protein-PII] uridylyltransferase [Lichenihabitans psoromatis]|uniref:[protein-PII] uridylyltransferase n=1 Tax=Lichenihabitans psoromatis TaxID=2528642 RepID=UPI001A9478B6|nr:[protein-PII] uridylyltransferase [Lichenihabitans psoromatis]